MDTPRTAAEDCRGLLEFDPAETLQNCGPITSRAAANANGNLDSEGSLTIMASGTLVLAADPDLGDAGDAVLPTDRGTLQPDDHARKAALAGAGQGSTLPRRQRTCRFALRKKKFKNPGASLPASQTIRSATISCVCAAHVAAGKKSRGNSFR